MTAISTPAALLETLHQFEPDLLISGLELEAEEAYKPIELVRIYEAERGRLLPVIALTNCKTLRWKEKALSAGFQAYLLKSGCIEELLESVLTCIETR